MAESVGAPGPPAGREPPRSGGRRRLLAALRVVAVLGLAVDVHLHLALAEGYDAVGTVITQGALFRVEAGLAALAAALLAARGSRLAWRTGGTVALAGVLAVVVTRHVEVPALGPLPALYEPAWYPEKVWVTVAMLATVLAWTVREVLWRLSPGHDTDEPWSARPVRDGSGTTGDVGPDGARPRPPGRRGLVPSEAATDATRSRITIR